MQIFFASSQMPLGIFQFASIQVTPVLLILQTIHLLVRHNFTKKLIISRTFFCCRANR